MKRVKAKFAADLCIPWRPGQQEWLTRVTKYKQRAVTIVCYNDMIRMIKHNFIQKDNIPVNMLTGSVITKTSYLPALLSEF